MTGLDTIVEQILNEARDQSAEILNKAKRQSEDIIAQAQKEAEKVKASSDSRIQHEKTGGKSRAKSSSELKKRQAILKAKQEIIGEMMDKAYADILALPDDEYFAMVTKMLEKYALPKAGSIVFSDKDKARLPRGYADTVAKIAEAHGGSLKVSDDTCGIEGGFVLIYGGIEENCSFKAMFNAEKEQLADKVNSFLFV